MSFNNDSKSAVHLKETYFCDYNHDTIKRTANEFGRASKTSVDLTKDIFMYVRDKIIFGPPKNCFVYN